MSGREVDRERPPLEIAGIAVPGDGVSTATWRWARRILPEYLLAHSVRTYCWAMAISAGEGWTPDRRVLWSASLMHDVGLTRITRNTTCFEVEGAAIVRRFVQREGLSADLSDRVERSIALHMQPAVTLDDGVEPVLLDRATGLDVLGSEFSLVDAIRDEVVAAYPRRAFDRLFLAAITRDVARHPGCQSARLLHVTGLAARMADSPWSRVRPGH